MEQQARYRMLTKRKHTTTLSSNLHLQPCQDSWEEQAFAEDAAASLGGCVWPPRSYSCSFCRREFRSAQALGGHMNVHRRDRARLKQSPGPNNEALNHHHHDDHQNLFQNQFSSLPDYQYPSQLCTLLYSPNPNSTPTLHNIASPTTNQLNCNEKNLFPSPYNVEKEYQKKTTSPRSYSPPTYSASAADRYNQHNSDPRSKAEKNSRILESTECRAKVDCGKNDLSVSLNLVVRRTCPITNHDDENDEDEEEAESRVCKRRRYNNHVEAEVIEISPCSREELDLELRLGDRPSKVKF